MKKHKYQQGIIDPISIIGVLFLITTLTIGTAVVVNRNISLNISEKAACAVGDDSCLGTSNSGGKSGSGSSKNGYDEDYVIDSTNNKPGTAGYDCRKGGCGAGSGPVSGYYKLPDGSYRAIAGTGNDPRNYAENIAKRNQAAEAAGYDSAITNIVGGTPAKDPNSIQTQQLTKINQEKVELQQQQQQQNQTVSNIDYTDESYRASQRNIQVIPQTPAQAANNVIPNVEYSAPAQPAVEAQNLWDKFNNAMNTPEMQGLGSTGIGGGKCTYCGSPT